MWTLYISSILVHGYLYFKYKPSYRNVRAGSIEDLGQCILIIQCIITFILILKYLP